MSAKKSPPAIVTPEPKPVPKKILAVVLDEIWALFTAAPLGGVVMIVGLIFAVWSYSHLGGLVDEARTPDSAAILEALRIAAPALWFCVALWGRQIMVVAHNRQEAKDRFDYHESVIERIDEILHREIEVKEEVTKKSRSFWDRLRSEPKL